MKVLEPTQFGNPILRKQAKQISSARIDSKTIQQLIADMRHTLISEKLGIGLAAPQVGRSIALAVIAIRPMAHRPKVKKFDLVLINPKIVKREGNKELWEGCISAGSKGKADLFAKIHRHAKITVKFFDENGRFSERTFSGLKAQVMQHEIDHLNGVLFVDHVKDTKSFMTYHEYMQRIKHSDKRLE